MDIYAASIAHTAFWEKGKVNNPRDPGGLTNMGMTQKLYDAMRLKYDVLRMYPPSVNDLTPDQVNNCFRLEFWLPCHCHEMPPWLALAVFDAAVNAGAGAARRWVQQALRVKVDGWIGAQTIEAARVSDPKKTVSEFHAFRAWHYMLQDEIDDDFGLGWARRLIDTQNVALELIATTGVKP